MMKEVSEKNYELSVIKIIQAVAVAVAGLEKKDEEGVMEEGVEEVVEEVLEEEKRIILTLE